MKPPQEFREWTHGPVRKMGEAEGHVMVRRPGGAPFVLTKREWEKLPVVAKP